MEMDSIQRKIAGAKVERRGDQGPLPLRRECTAVVGRKRQPLCDLGEATGTGKAPAEQLAVPWRR